MTLTEFILEHADDDTSRLILARDRWPDIDMDKAATIIECRKRLRTKLPEWYAVPDIIYPDRLSSEQSSSTSTASYKAHLAERILRSGKAAEASKGRIADLTGGLGADSLAFSRIASRVLYNEMDAERAAAARHNFPLLGARNIDVISYRVEPESAGPHDFWDELRSFRPDIVYMDPARRSATGNKVFLPEDCSPDVLTLIPGIFSIVPVMLLKLSPMADISMLLKRLHEHGAATVELHVVASGGECKELLLWCVPYRCRAIDTRLIVSENGKSIATPSAAEGNTVPRFLQDPDRLSSMQYLFEPGKALAKAGLFNAIGSMFVSKDNVNDAASMEDVMLKAGRSTHIYFSGKKPAGDAADFGKIFRIVSIIPLNKQGIKDFGARYPEAEVSARNIPLTSDELRKKLKVRSGGDIHIFGIRIDFSSSASSAYLIAATRNPSSQQ